MLKKLLFCLLCLISTFAYSRYTREETVKGAEYIKVVYKGSMGDLLPHGPSLISDSLVLYDTRFFPNKVITKKLTWSTSGSLTEKIKLSQNGKAIAFPEQLQDSLSQIRIYDLAERTLSSVDYRKQYPKSNFRDYAWLADHSLFLFGDNTGGDNRGFMRLDWQGKVIEYKPSPNQAYLLDHGKSVVYSSHGLQFYLYDILQKTDRPWFKIDSYANLIAVSPSKNAILLSKTLFGEPNIIYHYDLTNKKFTPLLELKPRRPLLVEGTETFIPPLVVNGYNAYQGKWVTDRKLELKPTLPRLPHEKEETEKRYDQTVIEIEFSTGSALLAPALEPCCSRQPKNRN